MEGLQIFLAILIFISDASHITIVYDHIFLKDINDLQRSYLYNSSLITFLISKDMDTLQNMTKVTFDTTDVVLSFTKNRNIMNEASAVSSYYEFGTSLSQLVFNLLKFFI